MQNVIQIEYIPIAEIRAYENNPRNNDKAVQAVVKSIKKFGVRSPAIVDKDNVLIAGHTRLKAAIELGMTEFPCVRADDLSKNQAKAFRLADNRMQEDSSWDAAALAQEFADLKENGFDLSETGFDEFEIEGLEMFGQSYDEQSETNSEPEPSVQQQAEYSGNASGTNEAESEVQDNEFVCLICCENDEEKAQIAKLIGETGELKRSYKLREVREMIEHE